MLVARLGEGRLEGFVFHAPDYAAREALGRAVSIATNRRV